MSYQVIARKYRPQNFEEVVGQEAVVTTLKNAISSKRLHHAYLFSGARGIGKTSLARIFAKAVNCEQGPTLVPCNQCNFCREITAGTSLDIQEIDGASNTSVDNVRELREQLKYLSAAARYKIYIIDEVHMLSTSAFNALLKTLEEPPPHVIFMFATTESHKIPATILSRCQRFDLRRISSDQLLERLKTICEKEAVTVDLDALRLIVREAQGSLRDAQSLLDQAIAYSDSKLNLPQVSAMLGLADTQSILEITRATLQGSSTQALAVLQEVYERGHDLKQFALQWLGHWRHLLIYASTKEAKLLADLTELERQEITGQAALLNLEALDIGFNLLHQGVEAVARSEFPKMLFDVLAVRMSHLKETASLAEILEGLKAPSNSISPIGPIKKESHSLEGFLQHVKSARPQVGSILDHIRGAALIDNTVFFQFDSGDMWMDWLTDRKDQLEALAAEFFGRPFQIKIQDSPLPQNNSQGKPVLQKIEIEKPTTIVDPMVDSALKILNAELK